MGTLQAYIGAGREGRKVGAGKEGKGRRKNEGRKEV